MKFLKFLDDVFGLAMGAGILFTFCAVVYLVGSKCAGVE